MTNILLSKMRKEILLFFFIFIILVSGCTQTVLSNKHNGGEEKEFHIHADFKVYIDDKAIDFSIPMYQLKSESVHVEGGIGELIHVHKKGITIGFFFETLDIKFNNTCLIIPLEGSYCNTDEKKLSFFVNNIENNEFESYEIKDLDKILISFGEGNIKKQLESITNLASER